MAAFFCARTLASTCMYRGGAGRRHSERKRPRQCLHTCTHTFQSYLASLTLHPPLTCSSGPPWRRQSYSYTCECKYTHTRGPPWPLTQHPCTHLELRVLFHGGSGKAHIQHAHQQQRCCPHAACACFIYTHTTNILKYILHHLQLPSSYMYELRQLHSGESRRCSLENVFSLPLITAAP